MIYPPNEMLDLIKGRPHYEVSFATETVAREEEYQLNEGWSPFLDTEVDGTTLYFSDAPCFEGRAAIVAEDWWDGRAKLVNP